MINKDDIRDLDEGGVMWEYYTTASNAKTADMVREFSHKLLQVPDPALYSKLICEEYEEWKKEKPCTEGELKELADLVYVIYGYANAIGYNLDEALYSLSRTYRQSAFGPIHIHQKYEGWVNEKPRTEGDLKKLTDLAYEVCGYANAVGYDLDEAIRRVHANNLGRCLQPDGTIKRREDGKVIKNPDYPKVTLADLI
jgi:predicted HAD superfamily Cof-like phosphohydrolase